MNMWGEPKDGGAFDETHVFPDLRKVLPSADEQSEDQIRAAMAGWPGLKRIHRA